MKGPNVTEISNAQNPAATSDAAPKGARARPVASIAIDQIEVGARLRHLRPEKVDEIAESIAAQSLLQSIIVRGRGAGYELVAGLHRLEASRKCGHEAIRAEICDTATSDDEAALIQIDETCAGPSCRPPKVPHIMPSASGFSRGFTLRSGTAATGGRRMRDQVLILRT
jgi:ParB-like nuclease domain